MMNDSNDNLSIGREMHQWAQDLFPICRSITGAGVRTTLSYLQKLMPTLTIHSVPSGEQVFDWQVPDEWNIKKAFIEDEAGIKVVDFSKHNLHVVGYSTPINVTLSLEELQPHLYSLPEQENAIPYITSYYSKRWGFCISQTQRESLTNGNYRVYIDSELKPGCLNYAEIIIPGESKQEILLSTYVCHPSMANNELSGPVVTTALVKWLQSLDKRKFTYRIVFIPETIGSVTYLSKNLAHLQQYTKAGFNITCIGDERCYSYLPSRQGDTLSDKVALHVLKHTDKKFVQYSWLDRGSDERQYCAPGVDLPIATIMRSKYGTYPEYHTSLDDLTFVTPKGLQGGYQVLKQALIILENNCYPQVNVLGEPQLGKRDLYPSLSTKETGAQVKDMMNLITYSDGKHSLLEIAEILDLPFNRLLILHKLLLDKKVMNKQTK